MAMPRKGLGFANLSDDDPADFEDPPMDSDSGDLNPPDYYEPPAPRPKPDDDGGLRQQRLMELREKQEAEGLTEEEAEELAALESEAAS